jgi:hypothetical protein
LFHLLFATRNLQAQVNGTVVKNFFKDYDRNNSGCIPLEEFLRACNLLDNRISSSAALALAKAYSQLQPNGMTLVNYRSLHADCTNESAFAGSAMNRLTRDGLKYNEVKQKTTTGNMQQRIHSLEIMSTHVLGSWVVSYFPFCFLIDHLTQTDEEP